MRFEWSADSAFKRNKASEKREPVFDYITKIFNYRTRFGIEFGPGKIRGSVNTLTKEADVVVTPEGIRAACEYVMESEFFKGMMEGFRQHMSRKLNERTANRTEQNI